MMDKRIIPECYADTALTEVLGYQNPNHQLGEGNVINALLDRGYNNTIGIALIDKDKKQSKRVKAYDLIRNFGEISLKRPPIENRFIIMHPNFEKWTWGEGQNAGLRTSDYNLPTDYVAYRKICKSQDAEKNSDLRSYLNALKQADTEIRLVDSLIKEILNGSYNNI